MRPLLVVFLGSLAAAPASADIYVYKEADGVEHYTNSSGLDGYTLIVAMLREEAVENRARVAPSVIGVAQYTNIVEEAAAEFGIEQSLIHAVITVESGYNANAVSRAGAQGLMQLMPGTAKRFAVADPFDPAANVRGGTRYLRDLLGLFDGDLELAVAAYNAGENAVKKYGGRIPPYKETLAYVPKVLSIYRKYKAVLGGGQADTLASRSYR
jgi:soluble lytic murein transglycosylase-like protein